MDVRLSLPSAIHNKTIAITGSKSETNRLLLLKGLYPGITIGNASQSDDSEVMQQAMASADEVIDVYHAGTAMRFLTAYFAIQQGRTVTLTGSQRMQERPIGILVDALRSLGADIEYLANDGYPPLKITGQKLTGSKVTVKANVSSQYITALLLIAGRLQNGLTLTLEGEITSMPYINMTLVLLTQTGISAHLINNVITVQPTCNPQPATILVESDWSSASYYYSIIALSAIGASVTLSSYKPDSLQGDSALAEIYKSLGVDTVFNDGTLHLTKNRIPQPATLNLDLNNTPDIAQTIAVTCFGLGLGCHLTGLHTLKIKETDRLTALKTELEKCGAAVMITDDSLTLSSHQIFSGDIALLPLKGLGGLLTYNDHRMAMAFAPLAVKAPIVIQDAGVVSKSYPAFWDDLQQMGFVVDKIN